MHGEIESIPAEYNMSGFTYVIKTVCDLSCY